jgi:segregation and condensation protein B
MSDLNNTFNHDINNKLFTIKNYIKKIETKINTYNGIKYYLDKKFKKDINFQIYNCINENINLLSPIYTCNIRYIIKMEITKIFKNYYNDVKLYKYISNFKIALTTYIVNYNQLSKNKRLRSCNHINLNLHNSCFECYICKVIDMPYFNKYIFKTIFYILHLIHDTDENKIIVSDSMLLNSNILKLIYFIMDETFFEKISKIDNYNDGYYENFDDNEDDYDGDITEENNDENNDNDEDGDEDGDEDEDEEEEEDNEDDEEGNNIANNENNMSDDNYSDGDGGDDDHNRQLRNEDNELRIDLQEIDDNDMNRLFIRITQNLINNQDVSTGLSGLFRNIPEQNINNVNINELLEPLLNSPTLIHNTNNQISNFFETLTQTLNNIHSNIISNSTPNSTPNSESNSESNSIIN